MATAIGTLPIYDPVLRDAGRKYSAFGLLIAVALHVAAVAVYWLTQDVTAGAGVGPLPGTPGRTTLEPPSIIGVFIPPKIEVGGLASQPDRGIPVPVPDASLVQDAPTLPPDIYGPTGSGSVGQGNQEGIGNGSAGTIPPDDNVPPPPFRAVEVPPQIIYQVTPEYPEMARRIGLQGKVVVSVWVDKHGLPHKAVVYASDSDLLNQAAVDAAMKFRFTPAIMNKGPVSVWINIPFTFKIKTSQ